MIEEVKEGFSLPRCRRGLASATMMMASNGKNREETAGEEERKGEGCAVRPHKGLVKSPNSWWTPIIVGV